MGSHRLIYQKMHSLILHLAVSEHLSNQQVALRDETLTFGYDTVRTLVFFLAKEKYSTLITLFLLLENIFANNESHHNNAMKNV